MVAAPIAPPQGGPAAPQTPATIAQAQASIVPALNAALTFLDDVVIEHARENRGIMLALISRTHFCFKGYPGAAKSMTLELIGKMMNCKVMVKQLGPTMTFSSVTGLPSVPALKEGRYEYDTNFGVWNSPIVMFDEIWRCNDAFMDEALTWMEQRVLTNGDVLVRTPLISLFGASNSLPDPETAMFDRFVQVFSIDMLSSQGMSELMEREFGEQRQPLPPVPVSFSETDLALAHQAAREVVIPKAVLDTVNTIAYGLRHAGVFISPRRQLAALRVVQASALLNGNSEADEDDLAVLANCFWRKEDERPTVSKLLTEHAAGVMTKAQEILDAVNLLAEQSIQDLTRTKQKQGVPAAFTQLGKEIYPKFEGYSNEMAHLVKEAAAKGKDVSRLQRMAKKVDEKKNEVAQAVR